MSNLVKKYSVVLADPPWAYKAWSGKTSRTADAHYRVMSLLDIMALDVSGLTNPNAALFMWSTMPCLPQALQVMAAWGFRYVTVAFCWVKLTKKGEAKLGLGHYTRGNAELCLLGVKGKGLPRLDLGVPQVIMSVPGRHSEKPTEVHARIERLYGDVPRIELFARAIQPGWNAWGNELSEDALVGPDLAVSRFLERTRGQESSNGQRTVTGEYEPKDNYTHYGPKHDR